jgi:polygalacturonase
LQGYFFYILLVIDYINYILRMLLLFKRVVFVMLSIILVAFVVSCVTKSKTNVVGSHTQPWDMLKAIESQITPPVFKDQVFNIMDYGAVSDGVVYCTESFKNAIKACAEQGGGKVLVPAGRYLTGPIHLETNVNLHLEKGAEILFSTNPNDYYPLVHTSFEGIELMNYSPLIYAKGKKNIAITGEGILNGQASTSNWWIWKGSEKYGYTKGGPSQLDASNIPRLMQLSTDLVTVSERVFGDGHYLRPNFIEPFDCQNVLIQGVKILNAPSWVIHPIKCTNVTIDGLTVESHGPNNDGCDPEYCKNVLIKNCTFNTGDDCIAIKAGRDFDGRTVAIKSENIIIRNCKMIDGHGGVVIGSEMSAGVKNVFVEDCVMDSPNLDRVIRIKTNSRRGGTVEGVYVRNIEVGQVKECVLKLNMRYAIYPNQTGNFIPQIRSIYLENIRVKNAGKYAIWADGLENSFIENIYFKDITIEKVNENFRLSFVKNLTVENTLINDTKIKKQIFNQN